MQSLLGKFGIRLLQAVRAADNKILIIQHGIINVCSHLQKVLCTGGPHLISLIWKLLPVRCAPERFGTNRVGVLHECQQVHATKYGTINISHRIIDDFAIIFCCIIFTEIKLRFAPFANSICSLTAVSTAVRASLLVPAKQKAAAEFSIKTDLNSIQCKYTFQHFAHHPQLLQQKRCFL